MRAILQDPITFAEGSIEEMGNWRGVAGVVEFDLRSGIVIAR